MRARLVKTPARSWSRRRISSHSADHVEALAAAWTALDLQLGAVDDHHLGPPLGQQSGAQRLREHVDPVCDQLPVPRRIATLGPPRATHRRQPAAIAAGGERPLPVGRAARHQRQCLTDLAGSELVAARTRLPLPRLDPRRAQAEPARHRPRMLLTRQRRREAMRPLTVPRPAPPTLATMRRLSVPPTAHHLTARVLRIRPPRDLHPPETSSPLGRS